MIRRPPRSTLSSSSAASDVYKRQEEVVHLDVDHAEPWIALQQPLSDAHHEVGLSQPCATVDEQRVHAEGGGGLAMAVHHGPGRGKGQLAARPHHEAVEG